MAVATPSSPPRNARLRLGLALGLGLLLGPAGVARAGHPLGVGCPYAALWHPGSKLKLPDGHPAIGLGVRAGHNADAKPAAPAALGALRGLLQAAEAEGEPAVGYCESSNPFSGSLDCTQFLSGSAAEAEAVCAQGVSMPGQAGAFTAGARCPGYAAADFGGECTREHSSGLLISSVLQYEEGNPMADCEMITTVCSSFIRGDWAPAPACAAPAAGAEGEDGALPYGDLGGGECALMPGVGGGAHMAIDAFWTDNCPSQSSPYANPLTYMIDDYSLYMDSPGKFSRSRTWYSARNNAKRMDNIERNIQFNFTTDDEDRFDGPTTMFHINETFYNFPLGGGECLHKMNSPVGILRPNWILDEDGSSAQTQYLGKTYISHNGAYELVKSWRKVEPLEDAYMIVHMEDEPSWETPEGLKARHLMRVTPGAPGAGDTVQVFSNHTTDFDEDEIFDIGPGGVFDISKCPERGFDGNFTATGAVGNNTGFGGNFTSFLNTHPDLRVDESFVSVLYDGEGEIVVPNLGVMERVQPGAVAVPLNGSVLASETPRVEVAYRIDEAAGTVTFTVSSDEATNYVGVAFPETACAMVPADAVISKGELAEVDSYRLTDILVSGARLDAEQELLDAEAEVTGEGQTFSFTRKYDNGGAFVIDPSRTLSMNYAVGVSPDVTYHMYRGCFTMWSVDAAVPTGRR